MKKKTLGEAFFVKADATKPDQVAELVTFLVSNKASFISASYYLIDGEYTAI